MDSSQPPSASMWALLAVAGVLILLSMIFSATESAFLSINKLRVRSLRNQKNRRAMLVWRLLNGRDRLINTLLVGNNIVNIALSSILTYVSIKMFGSAGVGIATFCATMLLLIFGEIFPKTVATHHPEPIAFFFCGFIAVLEVLLSPFVAVFTFLSRITLKIFKVDASKKKVSFTEEEIKTFLDVGLEQGVLERNEKTMMRRVFKFSDLEAKDIMVPRKNIKAVSIDDSYQKIVEYSERIRLSRFPVYGKNGIDDILGILYVKDLLCYKNRPEEFSVKKIMRPPLFILETKKMSSIQQMLRENRQSMAVVIDEYSGTYGVLTSEDLVREIFGPVADEYKPYAKRVELTLRNLQNAEVDGLSRLIDINEQLGISLYSRRCETLGGYICETLGSIPRAGDSIVRSGYKFIVSKMDDKRVSRVRIRECKEAGDEQ